MDRKLWEFKIMDERLQEINRILDQERAPTHSPSTGEPLDEPDRLTALLARLDSGKK